jgi:hypothetical protein
MTLFGPGFLEDSALIKWGEGATRNAMMQMAASVWDLPILFDNYKPNTGFGNRDFVNLIHNIIEGGEKDRLSRASKLQESKEIYSWPVCTGEDVPDSDTASVARLLLVEFDYVAKGWNHDLSLAQTKPWLLNEIGTMFIYWIASEEGKDAARFIVENKDDRLKATNEFVLQKYPKMVNSLRVSKNLQKIVDMYELLCKSPVIGPVMESYQEEFWSGYMRILTIMHESTNEAFEANHFIETLKALVDSKRAVLLPKDQNLRALYLVDEFKFNKDQAFQRLIGYEDADHVYLIPKLARSTVDKFGGRDGLNGISNRALFSQLVGMGIVEDLNNSGKASSLVKVDGKVMRVLVISKPKWDEFYED